MELHRCFAVFGVAVLAGVAWGQSCTDTTMSCQISLSTASTELAQLFQATPSDAQAVTQKCSELQQTVDRCVSELESCTEPDAQALKDSMQSSFNTFCSADALCTTRIATCSSLMQGMGNPDEDGSEPDMQEMCRKMTDVKQCFDSLNLPSECDSNQAVMGIKTGMAQYSAMCGEDACPQLMGCFTHMEDLAPNNTCDAVPPILQCYENLKGQCKFDESGVTFREVEQLGAEFCKVMDADPNYEMCDAVGMCAGDTAVIKEMENYGEHQQIDKLMKAVSSASTWCQYVKVGIDCTVKSSDKEGCALSASMLSELTSLQATASATCKTSGAGAVHFSWVMMLISVVTLAYSRL